MRASSIWRPVGSLLAVLVVLFSSMGFAAAANTSGNGLRVSPVRADLTIKPGSTFTLNVNVTNVTAKASSFQMVVNDFIANPNESGEPSLILGANQFAPSHSLKRFIQPGTNFSLYPGQEKSIPVVIKIPKDAPGGGYYGVVRFAPANATTGPNQNLSLAGSVGTLILLKVPGDIKEQLTIASFDVRHKDSASSFFLTNKDLSAVVRFQNEGNIQEAPFGKILLKNHSGKTLATYEINNVNPAGNVLPDSIRRFSVALRNVGGLGQYKLEGNFGYGTSGQLLTAKTTFYVIPLWLVLLFIFVVALLVFLVFGLPKLIRAYNDRVIRNSRRR